MTNFTKVIITAIGTQIFISEWAGAHFTLGTILGIIADGLHLGITVDGMIHGITAMADGMVAGIDGTRRGTTAVGTHPGLMVDGMTHGFMVAIMVMVEVIVMDFTMATIAV